MFPRSKAAPTRRADVVSQRSLEVFSKRRNWISVFVCLAAGPVWSAGLVFEGGGSSLETGIAEIEALVMHGRPSVQFHLDPASSAAFAALTGAMIGETLEVTLCDHVLVSAVVRERLDGVGIINLPSIEGAIAVAEVVRGDAGCEALEPHIRD